MHDFVAANENMACSPRRDTTTSACSPRTSATAISPGKCRRSPKHSNGSGSNARCEVRSAKRDHMTLRFGVLSFCVAASVGLLWASEGDVKRPVVTVVDQTRLPRARSPVPS